MGESYRKASAIHKENLSKLPGASEKAKAAYILGRSIDWFGKDFAESLSADKGRASRLIQCVNLALGRSMSVPALLEPLLATLATPVNGEIELALPESWHLRQRDPWRYYDACTPQYNLMVTVRELTSTLDAPVVFLRRILPMLAPDAEPVSLGPTRAIVHYRSELSENGQPKDDHHWVLAEKNADHIRHALFTLSVLAAHADRPVTDALAASLTERIQKARFLV